MCSVHAPIPRGWSDLVRQAKNRRLDGDHPDLLSPIPSEMVVNESRGADASSSGMADVSLATREGSRARVRQTRTRERYQQQQQQQQQDTAQRMGAPDQTPVSQPPRRETSEPPSQPETSRFPPPPPVFRRPQPPSQPNSSRAPPAYSQQPSSFLFTPVQRQPAAIPVEAIPATPELQTSAAIHARIRAAQEQRQRQRQHQRHHDQHHQSIDATLSAQSSQVQHSPSFFTPLPAGTLPFRVPLPGAGPSTPDPFNRTPAPDDRFLIKNVVLSTVPGSASMTPQSPLPPNPALIKRAPISSMAERRAAAAAAAAGVSFEPGLFSMSSSSIATPVGRRHAGFQVAVPTLASGSERRDDKGKAVPAWFASPTPSNPVMLTPPRPHAVPTFETPSLLDDSPSKFVAMNPVVKKRAGKQTGPPQGLDALQGQPSDDLILRDNDSNVMPPSSEHPTPPPEGKQDWYSVWMSQWNTTWQDRAIRAGFAGEADVRDRYKIAGCNWDVYNRGGGRPRVGISRL